MKTLILILGLFSFSSFAQELEPVINFLRGTPAYVHGTVSFDAASTLYDENWTQVKIIPRQRISFTFQENRLEVHPESAFYVKSHLFRVKIKSVMWTPKTGVVTHSELPADFTGLSRKKVSAEVAEILEGLFGQKLRVANVLLKRIRSQREMGDTINIVKAIVGLFTKSEEMSEIYIPKYRGDFFLNFRPTKDKAFNLYGMRIGIKANDTVTSGFDFTGDRKGVYPYNGHVTSAKGVDANTGKEWKAMARLVLRELELGNKGSRIEMHLGATEIVQGLLSLAELAAQRRYPGARCQECYDFATFPALRLVIEKQMREAIVKQVDELYPLLSNVNVSRATYNSYKKHESCNLTGISCVQSCNRNINNTDERKQCAQRCQNTANACLKR